MEVFYNLQIDRLNTAQYSRLEETAVEWLGLWQFNGGTLEGV